MNPDLVTRLVVGETVAVRLGGPVAASAANERDAPVKLVNGVWALDAHESRSAAIMLAPVRAARLRFGQVPRTTALLCALAVATLGVGFGLGRLWSARHEAPVNPIAAASVAPAPAGPELGALPIAPAVAENEGSALSLVNAPYSPEPTPGAASGNSDSASAAAAVASFEPAMATTAAKAPTKAAQTAPPAPVPIPRAAPPAPEKARRSAPQAPVAKPDVPKEASAGVQAKKDQDGRAVPPAVVLDEVPGNAKVAAAKAATTPLQPDKPAAVPASPSVAAKAPSLPRGTGLVAITPDGKIAVFTNPKTRLPEQFKLGDQLHGGDTVRSIDLKQGRVITSAKEYTLD